MFDRLDLSPRPFARMRKLDCGAEVPNPDKRPVAPTPFGPQRAQEILDAAKAASSGGPFTDGMRDHMTDGELVYVLAVWDCCPGTSAWVSAFNHIWRGDVEAYQRAAASVE